MVKINKLRQTEHYAILICSHGAFVFFFNFAQNVNAPIFTVKKKFKTGGGFVLVDCLGKFLKYFLFN